MGELFNYRSVLSVYMKQLIEVKTSAGISTQRLKWILKEFDNFAIAESLGDPHITEDFIQKWRATRIVDCEATLYAKYSIWSQLTKMMSRHGCECFIPKLPKQPPSNFTPYIFSEEQIKAIFEASDCYRLYDRRMGTSLFAMPALFRLLYSTGLRISEALSIKNKDVILDGHYIHLRKTKNGTERIAPICKSLEDVLNTYLFYRCKLPVKGIDKPDAPYFIKADGTKLTSNAVYRHFRKLLDTCDIPHKGNHFGPRVHDVRHTYAVHTLIQMDRNDMDLYTSLPILSASLGHHSLSATEKYIRLTIAMYPELEKKCSQINAFIYPKISRNDDYDN